MILKNNKPEDLEWLPETGSQALSMVYEVVRIIDRKPVFWKDHLVRLFKSMQLARLVSPLSSQEIEQQVNTILTAETRDSGNLMIRVTWNPDPVTEIGYIPHRYPTREELDEGVRMATFRAVRQNPNAKTWLPGVRLKANDMIKELGVYEVILVNDLDEVTEGSRSNLFCITNNVVLTPPVEDILPGITRQMVIRLAGEMGIRLKETKLPLNELLSSDAVFITGTSPGVLPAQQVDEQSFSPGHKIIRDLQKSYAELISGTSPPNPLSQGRGGTSNQ